MRRRDNRNSALRRLGEPIERLAQANIGLILTQAFIIRLSLEIADGSANDPDTLVLIAFLAACLIAGWLVFHLNRIIRRFPYRWQRISIAIGTVLLQATAFQLIFAYAS